MCSTHTRLSQTKFVRACVRAASSSLRALLDLTNQRLAGALEAVCHYKSLIDGSEHGEKDREACLLAQLTDANQVRGEPWVPA